MYQVEGLLDRSIAAKGYIIKEGQPLVNLSQIDFESLKDRFERGRKFTELERVQGHCCSASAQDGPPESHQDRLSGTLSKDDR